MALVCVHGPLRNLAGGRAELEVDGATVVGVLRGLEDLHPSVTGLDPRRARDDQAPHQRLRERRARRRGDIRRRRRPGRGAARDHRRDVTDDRVAGGHQEGPVRPRGRAGRAGSRSGAARSRVSRSTTRCATRRSRPGDRHRDLALLRPEDLVRRRSGRRVDAGRRGRAARGRRRGARADLGDRRRRGRRLAVRRRRPGRAVREPRRRRRPGSSTARCAPSTASTGTGSRAAAGCACTRSCPGRASPTSCRWRSRPPGCGTPTTTARPGAGQPGHRPPLPARGRARGHRASCASTDMERAAAPARAAVHPVPRWRLPLRRRRPELERRSATGCPRTSASRSTIDPADPDSAYVIPLRGDFDRVTPDGHVRVYETRDGGATWTPRGEGLPDHEAYLTVLRRPSTASARARRLQLYFGATSGDVFGSGDAGESWFTAATRLPPVFSVTASRSRPTGRAGRRLALERPPRPAAGRPRPRSGRSPGRW